MLIQIFIIFSEKQILFSKPTYILYLKVLLIFENMLYHYYILHPDRLGHMSVSKKVWESPSGIGIQPIVKPIVYGKAEPKK